MTLEHIKTHIGHRSYQIGGMVPSKPDPRDHIFGLPEVPATIPALPPLEKWSLVGEHLPAPRDQGLENDCVFQVLTAQMLFAASFHGLALPFPDLSRQFPYYVVRDLEGTSGQNVGTQPRDAYDAAHKFGICAFTTCPDDLATVGQKPSEAAYAEALKVMVAEYASVPQREEDIRAALQTSHPIGLGISVYESLMSEEVAKSGVIPMPDPNEAFMGGHDVLAVGFDLNHPTLGKAVQIQNSWGANWGDGGRAWIPFAYILNPNLCSDLWIVKSLTISQ